MTNFLSDEYKVYSQNGEDGVIRAIFKLIGATDKYFVEFGVGGGGECNTRLLRNNGWSGLMMDCEYEDLSINLHKHHIDAENINQLLDLHKVPEKFDLLSIDIDGNDYWVWKAINRRPRVVIIEYNGYLPTDSRQVIQYNPNFMYAHNTYFGAGLEAIRLLGISKGYTFAYVDFSLTNAFFIANECTPQEFDFRRVPRTDNLRVGDGPWVIV